jgi:hypothetical protein
VVGVVEDAVVGFAQVDDRDLVEVVGRVHGAAQIRVAQRRLVRPEPLGGEAGVDVAAAGLDVEADELRCGDPPALERPQPVRDTARRQPAAGG